jgi:hypothetical protein
MAGSTIELPASDACYTLPTMVASTYVLDWLPELFGAAKAELYITYPAEVPSGHFLNKCFGPVRLKKTGGRNCC